MTLSAQVPLLLSEQWWAFAVARPASCLLAAMVSRQRTGWGACESARRMGTRREEGTPEV